MASLMLARRSVAKLLKPYSPASPSSSYASSFSQIIRSSSSVPGAPLDPIPPPKTIHHSHGGLDRSSSRALSRARPVSGPISLLDQKSSFSSSASGGMDPHFEREEIEGFMKSIYSAVEVLAALILLHFGCYLYLISGTTLSENTVPNFASRILIAQLAFISVGLAALLGFAMRQCLKSVYFFKWMEGLGASEILQIKAVLDKFKEFTWFFVISHVNMYLTAAVVKPRWFPEVGLLPQVVGAGAGNVGDSTHQGRAGEV